MSSYFSPFFLSVILFGSILFLSSYVAVHAVPCTHSVTSTTAATAATMTTTATTNSDNSDYFLWSDENGQSWVFFSGGTSKPVDLYWVCYAAEDNIERVVQWITNSTAHNRVPYIHSYCFGDNGLRAPTATSNSYALAVQFDESIAKAIGNNSDAFVNLDTEWDVDEVLGLMSSADGIQCFKDRIQRYRTYARRTRVLSSPGLWKTDSQYTFFSQIDQLLDLRANLYHAVSNNDTCTLRTVDNTNWPNAYSLSQVLSLCQTIVGDRQRMNYLWNDSNKHFITGDMALTKCGWGAQYQAQMMNLLIDNMHCLYHNKWRGAMFRNSAPPNPDERATGNWNELGFVYSDNNYAREAMKKGMEKALNMMKNGVNCSASNGPFTVKFSIDQSSCSNTWAQLAITPAYEVTGVTLSYKTITRQVLERASWGPEYTGVVSSIDTNSFVVANITKYSGGYSVIRIQWLNSTATQVLLEDVGAPAEEENVVATSSSSSGSGGESSYPNGGDSSQPSSASSVLGSLVSILMLVVIAIAFGTA